MVERHEFQVPIKPDTCNGVVNPHLVQAILCLWQRALRVEHLLGLTSSVHTLLGTQRLLELLQSAFEIQVGHLHGSLLNAILLGKYTQISQLEANIAEDQIFRRLEGPALSLVGNQAGTVRIAFRSSHQR